MSGPPERDHRLPAIQADPTKKTQFFLTDEVVAWRQRLGLETQMRGALADTREYGTFGRPAQHKVSEVFNYTHTAARRATGDKEPLFSRAALPAKVCHGGRISTRRMRACILPPAHRPRFPSSSPLACSASCVSFSRLFLSLPPALRVPPTCVRPAFSPTLGRVHGEPIRSTYLAARRGIPHGPATTHISTSAQARKPRVQSGSLLGALPSCMFMSSGQ